MIDNLVPGRLVLLDGVPHLVERTTVVTVLQRIDSFRDRLNTDPTSPAESYSRCPVFQQITGDITPTGEMVDRHDSRFVMPSITPLVPAPSS